MRGTRVVFLASLALTAACVDPGRVTMPAPFTRDASPLPRLGRAVQSLAELRQWRERWRDARIVRYRVVQEVSCFCSRGGVRVLEVSDTVVSRAWDRATGREVRPDGLDKTVGQLLDYAVSVVEAGGYVAAAFDPWYGYPLDIYIDPLISWADDEVMYRLSTLTPS